MSCEFYGQNNGSRLILVYSERKDYQALDMLQMIYYRELMFNRPLEKDGYH